MPEPLRIIVRGLPKPQGSKKPFINKATGKPGMKESSGDALAWWRRAVTQEALAVMDASPAQFPLTGPILLTACFAFARPKDHYGTGRNAGTLKAGLPSDPCGRRQGDLSHLIRAVEDSVTDAGLWGDDSQVARYGLATGKYWADNLPELGVPGAILTILPL